MNDKKMYYEKPVWYDALKWVVISKQIERWKAEQFIKQFNIKIKDQSLWEA